MLARIRSSWRKNRHELKGLFDGGLPRFLLSARPKELGASVPVFCYHTITAADLSRDLRFLELNGYSALSGDALLAHLRREQPAPSRSVVLTFDDGAYNFYAVVLPLLERFRMHALAFVAPGMHFDVPPPEFATTLERPMTWNELREVHASGLVDVESHTYESRYLPSWPTPIRLAGVDPKLERLLRGEARPLREDLLLAKQRLEEQLPGKVVRHVAFPAYDGTPEGVAAAALCGYEACHWGIVAARPLNPPGASPYRIARVSHEYLRRLPGEGRASFAAVVRDRARLVRAAWVGASRA
jgi:peptidoglycan/xylan/chitin deacetylase (PgdA/CDA1 family)